jgi:nucleotide-binding universal stress UspA family protein
LFKRVLVPMDGSPISLSALDLAIEFSMRDGSKLSLLYVVTPPPLCSIKTFTEEMSKVGQSVLEEAVKKCESAGLRATKLLKIAENNNTSTANEIVKETIHGRYDCVILGSRGYAGEFGILMGSVAISVAISLPCTTIIVR